MKSTIIVAYCLERVSRLQHKEGEPSLSPGVSLVEETKLEVEEAIVWRRESPKRKLKRSAECSPLSFQMSNSAYVVWKLPEARNHLKKVEGIIPDSFSRLK